MLLISIEPESLLNFKGRSFNEGEEGSKKEAAAERDHAAFRRKHTERERATASYWLLVLVFLVEISSSKPYFEDLFAAI